MLVCEKRDQNQQLQFNGKLQNILNKKDSVLFKIQCFLSRAFRANRKQALCKVLIIFIFLFIAFNLMIPIHIYFTRDIEVAGWGVNISRKAADYIFPERHTSFTHAEANICSSKKPLVVVMVCSDTRNSRLRQAIRDTWAKNAEQLNILVLFLIGISENEDTNIKALEESARYKDVISEEVIDTYNNLTLKSIFMLKWMKKNCMDAQFLMKVDDDAYVNIENLHQYALLVKDDDMETFLVGKVQKNASPFRFHFSKWYMPRYMYPHDVYPNYIHGVAYMMSTNVAVKLFNQSLQHEFIHLEDVYLTGMCASETNIEPEDNELFHFYEEPVIVKCDAHSHIIVLSHHVDAYYMHKMNHQLRKCG